MITRCALNVSLNIITMLKVLICLQIQRLSLILRSFKLEEESLHDGHEPPTRNADGEITPQDVKLETVSSTISASTSTSSDDRVTEKLYRHDGTSSEDTQSTSNNRFYDVKVFLVLMCIFCITQGALLIIIPWLLAL